VEAITRPEELIDYLQLDHSLLPAARQAAEQFSLRVPRGYATLMQKGNPHDPLLRQVLPIDPELETVAGFNTDPVGDLAATSQPGLLHKYHGRALVIATGSCAIHCRFCFRRHFPYQEAVGAEAPWDRVLKHLRQTPDIREVILSGGDPLMLDNDRLASRIRSLEAIPHLSRLRIHSRLPVALPERVDEGLLQLLTQTRLRSVMVVHCNHANELGPAPRQALQTLKQRGIDLLNQSVLLKGVNDDLAALANLSEALFDAGALPYYLHLLDRVQGAAHFEVSRQTAQTLHRQLRERLPGYLVPRLVWEQAGAAAKLPVSDQ
jgi:EF-P beta-lysylation protein EpmB